MDSIYPSRNKTVLNTVFLYQACRAYVNTNVVATVISKSPELLASYVDSLLKKSNKEAGDATMEDSLNDCVSIG